MSANKSNTKDWNIIEMNAIKVKLPGYRAELTDISNPERRNGIIRIADDLILNTNQPRPSLISGVVNNYGQNRCSENDNPVRL